MTGIESVMKFNIRKVQNGYIVKEPGLRGREWISTNPLELLKTFYLAPKDLKENINGVSFSVDKAGKLYTITVHDGYVELIFSADTLEELEKTIKGHI
jgi:hypothetical protein